jgi:hypothetical protein
MEEHYFGQIDFRAALAVDAVVRATGVERFPNLAVLDIENLYLPIELPAVLVGQPLSIGSCPALLREIADVRGDADPKHEDILDFLEEACLLAVSSSAVVLVSG